VHGLQTWPDEADIARAEALPVGPGGAVLHNCRTLHSSGPNVSDHVRRAFAMEWQTPPVKREAPYERPWHWEGRDAFEARTR
jgi:ectoine hydroxylase-related dioxygenase (phytanoyl-CoA dioxygenase family)